jgi:hypothetical protein
MALSFGEFFGLEMSKAGKRETTVITVCIQWGYGV